MRDPSPTIDALAARGVLFENAYSQAPYTPPSQATLLTSVYPSVHQVWLQGVQLSPDLPVVTEVLRDAGYATGGFTQLSGKSYRRGFDTYESLIENVDRTAVRQNVRTVARWLERHTSEQPFFMFLHMYDVHAPYTPPLDVLERFEPAGQYTGPLGNEVTIEEVESIRDGTYIATPEDFEHMLALYDAELVVYDGFFEGILGALAEAGKLDSTVIAIVSDHGEEFGEHGSAGHTHSLYEELLRTPLILSGPGIPSGLRIPAPARNLDVAPTLLRLAGVPAPPSFAGADLAALWEGREQRARVVVAEKKGARALIVDGVKYLTVPEEGIEELYDLRVDPGEQNDLALTDTALLEQMRALALEWDAALEATRANVGAPGEVELSEEEIARLRALGYIQ